MKSAFFLILFLAGWSVAASDCYYDNFSADEFYFDSDSDRLFKIIEVHTLRGVRVRERTPGNDVVVYVEIRDHFEAPIFAANSTGGCVSFDNHTIGPSDEFYVFMRCVTPNTLCNVTLSISFVACGETCYDDMCTDTPCDYPCSMCIGECIDVGVCLPANQSQSETPSMAPGEEESPPASPSEENQEAEGLTTGEQAGIAVSVLSVSGLAAAAAFLYVKRKGISKLIK
jgi:hypothetical protein